MQLSRIEDVAARLDISPENLIPYGRDKAKVLPAVRDSGREPGKLILVTAITPTRAGEGKTTTSIGLAQGLSKLGQRVALALREPSVGPTFGIKGGATGGGKATVQPAVDINLHFTGDFHAISSAHNLLAAILDNHLHFGNELGIDARRVSWPRVVDLNDRALRQVVVGLGGTLQGVPRETSFDITPASEVMAVLCLAKDADDLRARLGRMIVAQNGDKEPVTADDLQATGGMMALLRDALHPNLVQTADGVPAFVHGGPFANIAHGCNSVLATQTALATADWVVTEAGFGADLGAEKFLDIKCPSAGLKTAAVVLVATARALKLHGGVGNDDLNQPNPGAVEKGLPNLERHIEIVRSFGGKPVVALNRFPSDTDDELAVIRAFCEKQGVPCAASTAFADGADGATELAGLVMSHIESDGGGIHQLYDHSLPIKEKMQTIASRVYGAGEVHWQATALRDLNTIERLGYGGLPLCVAKTHSSFTDDPKRLGAPSGFELNVRRLLLSAGAGFVIPLLGDMLRMPGLPRVPAAANIDLVDGEVKGLK